MSIAAEALKKLAAPFAEKDIEWRIGQAGVKGNGQVWAMCLAYVQARAIMTRLDEVCGPENWKVSYRFIPGATGMEAGVVCELSVKVGGEWVTKEDGAEQTDIESFKGGISGALKRAGVLWGIGRYLYDLDAAFAKVVDQGTEGAQYGQTKEKKAFYWLPPNLPKWALPDPKDYKGPNGIHPGQVAHGDGHTPDKYVIPGGKFAKRTIDEVIRNTGYRELGAYILWCEKKWSEENKPAPAWWAEFAERAGHAIGDCENGTYEPGAAG